MKLGKDLLSDLSLPTIIKFRHFTINLDIEVIPFFFRSLNKTNIQYSLGGENLDGMVQGDLFRYGPEIGLYIFSLSSQ